MRVSPPGDGGTRQRLRPIASTVAAQPSRPPLVGPGLIQLSLLLLAAVVGFWYSLYKAIGSGLETPMGLAPAGVPLAVLAGWLAYRRDGRSAPSRDGFLDTVAGLVPAAIALGLLWRGPQDGWRFWADRVDLLAFDLFGLAAACWLFGVAAVWRYRSSLLVLLIASPPVLNWFDQHVAPGLALVTSSLARPIAGALGVPFAPDTPANVFKGLDLLGHQYDITIADVCSGINSWLSILIVGVPAAQYLGLAPRAFARWLVAGIVLAFTANLIRIVALLTATYRFGAAFGLGVLHPVLGVVLVGLVFAVLLFGAKRAPSEVPTWLPQNPGVAAVVLLAAASMAAAVGQTRLLPFAALPDSGVAGPSVRAPLDVVPNLPGWSRQVSTEISWQDLFGPQSRSLLLTYSAPGQPIVTSQVVVTPDNARLLEYTPERCGVYHGEEVRGQKTVDLGLGQVGYLVDTQAEVPANRLHPEDGKTRSLRFNVLYWYVPYTVGDRHWLGRMMLILDSDAESELSQLSPAQRGFAPGGRAFDRVDAALVAMGRNMVSRSSAI